VRGPGRVTLVFASKGVGGAERSMLRLMERAHPALWECEVVVAARENPAFRKDVEALGVPYHGLRAGDARGFLRILKASKPDVLYVFGRFRTLPWIALARLAGVPRIVAAERSAANRWSDRLARRLDRSFVDGYIANSRLAARNLKRVVGERAFVRVVPNGIPTGPLFVREGHAGSPTLLCVGNITENKGQRVLLEAVRLLRRAYPDLRATLLGKDFTNGAFFRDAREAGLQETYEAPGFADDVWPYLARATVVVLPTLRREGMPTSLLEAMSAGVPVVASRVGGVPEVVEDGVTGVLVPPGDREALARALERLLDDPVERTRLAATARRHVLLHHDLSVMVRGHAEAFEAALSPPKAEARSSVARVVHIATVDLSLRYLLLNQLTFLKRSGYEVLGVSSYGPDVATIEEQGIPHLEVPLTRRLTPLRDLVALGRLYRVLRRTRPTIVHTHTPKPGLLGQIAARLAGVPIVVNTLHGFYFHDRMSRPARAFYVLTERIAALFSDVILSQNPEDRETAVRLGIARPDRIRTLGNGIDLRRFDPLRLPHDARAKTRKSLGIPEDARVVGFVGRLVAEKGVLDLLAALRTLAHRMDDVLLLLVGAADEEKADRLRQEAPRALGVEERCIFAGVRQDMPELYASMDVFALPSHREGFPRAPMEAAAMGLPSVVTDIRGCRQVVASGENGLLVPPADPWALAEALHTILEDRDLARRLGDEGRARALREFDEELVFRTVEGEYARLLRAKGLHRLLPPRAAERIREARAAEA
jgi:glycosyltransferase involved in cell wall biosynthesis